MYTRYAISYEIDIWYVAKKFGQTGGSIVHTNQAAAYPLFVRANRRHAGKRKNELKKQTQ